MNPAELIINNYTNKVEFVKCYFSSDLRYEFHMKIKLDKLERLCYRMSVNEDYC